MKPREINVSICCKKIVLINMVCDTQIKEVIQKIKTETISDEQIISDIGMAEMPLLSYLMTLKYNTIPVVIPIENDLMIRIGECNLANFSYLAIALHFLKFDGKKLVLEGLTSFPTQITGVEFGARVNGSLIPIKTDSSNLFDLSFHENIYEYRKRFCMEINVEDYLEISFYNSYNNIAIDYGRINAMRFSPIADIISNQYYYDKGYVFFIKDNKIICKKVSLEEAGQFENRYRETLKEKYPPKYEWVVNLRDYFFNHKHTKPVFLIMDRADEADDNGRIFWEYLLKNKQVDAYFVLSENALQFKKMSRQGKVIPLYSQEHYQLALTADFIISSQCNGIVENPFWDDCEFFRDLYHRPKMIFLQHGVIKDDMSPTLNRFNTNFTGFLTSTLDEWKSIIDYPYLYTENEVWNIGLPRFDKLRNKNKKIILIMPTWRKELMVQQWDANEQNMRWELSEDIHETAFYKRYFSLLNNNRLRKLCLKYGYKIVFIPHPLVRKYFLSEQKKFLIKHYFIPKRDISYQKWFGRGAVLITDYSSVAFDFLYLKKPVIYYQFDKAEFFENHTYKKGYFDYEKELYGNVAVEEDELIDCIEEYLKNKCALQQEHTSNIDALFERTDNHCENLLNKLLSIYRLNKRGENE